MSHEGSINWAGDHPTEKATKTSTLNVEVVFSGGASHAVNLDVDIGDNGRAIAAKFVDAWNTSSPSPVAVAAQYSDVVAARGNTAMFVQNGDTIDEIKITNAGATTLLGGQPAMNSFGTQFRVADSVRATRVNPKDPMSYFI